MKQLNQASDAGIFKYVYSLKTILCCFLAVLFFSIILSTVHGERKFNKIPQSREMVFRPEYETVVDQYVISLFQDYSPHGSCGTITFLNPLDDSLFPRDMASPTFEWIDKSPEIDGWLLRIKFESEPESIYMRGNTPKWIPGRKVWDTIKQNSLDSPARISILGYSAFSDPVVVSEGKITISTSRDAVDAPILFRRVPPSFEYADEHPETMEWCLADIASYESPAVIMSGQKYCASCHTFSSSGDTIGMDMDFMEDKGAYIISSLRQDIILKAKDFINWNKFPRDDGLQGTGLFSRLSPDGNYVASTVNDIGFLARIRDPYCSQLFFPIQGHLAVYSRKENTFTGFFTGERDRKIIETDPSWSADGTRLFFSRTVMTRDLYSELGGNTVFTAEDVDIENLNARYPVRFNVYSAPFHSGMGGISVPLRGASNNGMSNYFARCSPNGRWIVFTQSDSGLALQPDSRLCIIPFSGGEARIMNCNRSRMNSWHSWSPNSRWLAFVSKENMPYTELYLTHIDESGYDSVPVLVSRLNKPGFAVNVPEFADSRAGHLRSISLQSEMDEYTISAAPTASTR